jgi:hypothetical protein
VSVSWADVTNEPDPQVTFPQPAYEANPFVWSGIARSINTTRLHAPNQGASGLFAIRCLNDIDARRAQIHHCRTAFENWGLHQQDYMAPCGSWQFRL